jgi:hypothetical protein
LITSQDRNINVAFDHATHTNIDNGQIVTRMDQPLIFMEKQVTRIATNNIKHSDLPTGISQIEQQQ